MKGKYHLELKRTVNDFKQKEEVSTGPYGLKKHMKYEQHHCLQPSE